MKLNKRPHVLNDEMINKLIKNGLLSSDHAKKIKLIFQSSLATNPNLRWDADLVIISAYKILHERNLEDAKRNSINQKLFRGYEKAYTLGSDIYFDLIKRNNDSIKKKKYPKTMDTINYLDLQEYQKSIFKKIDQLMDVDFIVEAFCNASGIKAIKNMKTIKEVRGTLNNIFDRYQKSFQELSSLGVVYSSNEGENFMHPMAKNKLDLRKKYLFEVDSLQELTPIFNKAIEKLKAFLKKPHETPSIDASERKRTRLN